MMKNRHLKFSYGLSRATAAAALALYFVVPMAARGQDQPPKPPQPSAPQTNAPSPPAAQSGQPPADKPDPNQPQVYDPYHAMKAMEIGEYYLRKGDAEAALDRFQDAIRYKYDFARPRLLIAEIYERRHDNAQAIHYYSEYLKILPNAPDAKKIKERIEKLSKRVEAADSRQPARP
jgi:tetratricopeptide (TPR) repeat protein